MRTFLIAAVTADGYIAQNADQISTSWTSREDKKFFAERTKQAGVVVMGATTHATIGKALPGRRTIVYSHELITQIGVETTSLPPDKLLEQLEREGAKEVAICGGATIYTMFLESGLVNTLYLTLEPYLFGRGISLFNKPLNTKLELVSVQTISPQTVLLEYRVLN